jgi:NAD+ diphosphatase
VAELAAAPDARLLQLSGTDPVLNDEGRLQWSGLDTAEELIFLGLEDGRPLFAPIPRTEPGQRAWGVFSLLGLMVPADAAIWGAARSLIEWHNRHGFCANCGTATTIYRAGWGRRCGNCAAEHYPRVDPVVIMLAEHRGKVLLARQPQYPAGRFSALAGFVEPGESMEEAVARELREEAAIQVKNVRYVASQPWPFPSSLMIACMAEASTFEIQLDAAELEQAMWVTADEVRAALAHDPSAPFLAPPPFAIANTLLRHWMEGAERLAGWAAPA